MPYDVTFHSTVNIKDSAAPAFKGMFSQQNSVFIPAITRSCTHTQFIILSQKYLFCQPIIKLCHSQSCIVIGSRRLMPPDALHPKAYYTNPGLYSFLLAPPGVSTREPSSERRNCLGEKWPVISTESCDFHAYTFGFFYMPQICGMGQTALLPFRRSAC